MRARAIVLLLVALCIVTLWSCMLVQLVHKQQPLPVPVPAVPGKEVPQIPCGDAEDALALHDRLRTLQFPSHVDPATHRTVIFSFYGEHWPVGTGWVFEHLLVAFTYALATNRTLVVARNDPWYLARDACSWGSYLCFFHPFSSVDERMLPRAPKQTFTAVYPQTTFADGHEQHIEFDFYPKADRRKYCTTCKYMHPESASIPWRFRRHGRMWLLAHLLKFLFRPKPHIMDLVAQAKAEWIRPVVTMHVRHGDKTAGKYAEAKMHPFADYMQLVSGFREAGYKNATNVFISTDNPRILEPSSLCHWPGYTFFFDPDEYRVVDGSGLRAREKRTFNRTAEGINAIKNIILLSEGDFFVGSMTSYFGHQAWRLMLASGRMKEWAAVDKDYFGFPYHGDP